MAEEHKIKIVADITPVVDRKGTQQAAKELRDDVQEELNKGETKISPTVNTEEVKKAVDNIHESIDKLSDVDIKPEMDTSSVKTASEQLRSTIQQIFDSSNGEQLNSRFQAMHDRMEKVRQKSIEVETELQRLAEENGTVYTKEYDKLTKQQADIINQIQRLKAEQAKIIQESPVTDTGESLGPHQPRYKQLEKELEGLREQNKSLTARIKDMKEQGLDKLTVEETAEYKKLVAQQEELNNKMRIYVLQWKEANAKMTQAGSGTEMAQMRKDMTGANKVLFGLTGSIRGITRLIPGVSATAVSSMSMVARSVMRLSSLSKEQLITAINTVRVAFEKLIATIVANPVMAIITAVIASLLALAKIIKDVKKEFETVEKFLKKMATTALGLFKKTLGSLAKNSFNLIRGTINFAINGVKNLINKLKSLKGVIQENLKLMAQWNDGDNRVNKALSNLTSSLAYLKGALASAFAPILTDIEPLLTRLMDQLAETTTLVGMFIAKLTGATSFQKAIRQQKDYAKSLANTSKAADKASQSLASYDKLQVISTKHNEEAEEEQSAVDWEEVSLSNFQLPEWLTNLYKLGQNTGSKLRNLLLSIPWDTVKDGSTKAAQGIADFVNGFVSVENLGVTVGNTIAELGNTLIGFYNRLIGQGGISWKDVGTQLGQSIASVFTKFDFSNLGDAVSNTVDAISTLIYNAFTQMSGEDIGKAITNFLTHGLDVDWSKIRLAFATVVKVLTDTINGTFTEDNFKAVAKTLSNLINTIFFGIKEFVKTPAFEEIGSALATGINDLVNGIDWKGNGKTLNKLATSILSLFTSAIQTINWDILVNDLATFLDQIDWDQIGDSLIGISEVLRNAIKNLWDQLEKTGVWDEVIDLISDMLAEKKTWEKLFKKIKASVIRELVLNKIWEIITAFPKRWWKRMVESFEIFKESGGFFADIADAIKENDWGRIGEDIINGVFAGIIGFVDLALTLANITPVLDIIKDAFCELFGIHSPATEMEFIGENIVLGIFEGFSLVDFAGKLSEWWDNNVAPWFTYERWKELGENMNSAMSDKAEDLKTSLAEKFVSIKDKIVEIFTTMKESIKTPINGVISVVESFVNTLITGINSILSKLNTIGFDFTNPFTGVTIPFGFDLPQLSPVTLPRLAQGGVIPPNREFAAILGDQKSGVNIETPLDTMIQAFKQAISETEGIHDPIILQLNGRTVAQAVWDEEQKRYKQTGRYQYT